MLTTYLLVPDSPFNEYKDIGSDKTLSKIFIVPEEVIRLRKTI